MTISHRTFLGVLAGALLVASIPASALQPRRTSGRHCWFNDDCQQPLVCSGGWCRSECKTNRDCPRSFTCGGERSFTYTAEGRQQRDAYRVCLPPGGQIVGRVELRPGVPARACRVDVLGRSGAGFTGYCESSGDFVVRAGLPEGRYELRITAISEPGRPSRTIVAWVNPGQYNVVPLIVLVPAAPPVAAGTGVAPRPAVVVSAVAPPPKVFAPPTLAPQVSLPAGHYLYTAVTAAPVREEGEVNAGGLVWKCSGTSCQISGPWPTPGVYSCQTLAPRVGYITAYGHPGAQLDAGQLAQCNKGLAPPEK